MEIQAIKCSDGFFVSSLLSKNLRFGDETVAPTFNPNWFKVSQISGTPKKVIPSYKKIIAYQLSDAYAPTEAMPSRVDIDFFKYEDGEYLNQHIKGLYEPEYEDVPETYEEIEAEVKIVGEVEGEIVDKTFSISVYGAYPNSDGKRWSVTSQQVKVSLIDEITLPRILLQEVPCEMSAEDSYKIIRAHVKDNIDPKVAKISSDYEFCLTVEKRIPLTKKEEYRVDENAWSGIFGGRRKKPKFVTKYRTERVVKVYETAPKPYQSYTVTKPFRGKDSEDLKKNIDTFLDALMEEINRPLKDCPTCEGQGVVEAAV